MMDGERHLLYSDDLEVQVVTTLGARVASVLDRQARREWLVGPRHRGAVARCNEPLFTETDHFGWDEMCPTVDACEVMGVAVRDHGELWCGPWECYDASPTSLTQVFESRTFGYRLERALKLSGPRLRADYRLSASASGPRLWAWHPQFAARPDTRLILEGDLDHVLDTSIATAVTSVPWRGHLDLAHDCVDGGDRMLYAPPEVRVSGATLVDPGGSSLSLRWDAQAIPYVGVWLDRGRYSNGGAIAVEPTTGFFDDVARAWAAGMVSVFDEGDSLAWWIEMEVS